MNLSTTFELDGLLTEIDIKDRNTLVYQCRLCKTWTIHIDYVLNNKHIPCSNCGKIDYDIRSGKSLRTYNPLTDKKRRPK